MVPESLAEAPGVAGSRAAGRPSARRRTVLRDTSVRTREEMPGFARAGAPQLRGNAVPWRGCRPVRTGRPGGKDGRGAPELLDAGGVGHLRVLHATMPFERQARVGRAREPIW